MTNTVYPPDLLLRKWEELIIDKEENVDVVLYEAFQAGADQELEAILQWLLLNGYAAAAGELDACRNRLRHEDRGGCSLTADWLYEARRPKPPSLKERGREALQSIHNAVVMETGGRELDVLKEIVESLPD